MQDVQKLVPYKIVDGQDGAAWVEVNGNKMSPSQVRTERRGSPPASCCSCCSCSLFVLCCSDYPAVTISSFVVILWV